MSKNRKAFTTYLTKLSVSQAALMGRFREEIAMSFSASYGPAKHPFSMLPKLPGDFHQRVLISVLLNSLVLLLEQ